MLTRRGQGRMGGPYAAGPGGTCVCPKCGATVAKITGRPCTDIRCPRCGAAMLREGTPPASQVTTEWR